MIITEEQQRRLLDKYMENHDNPREWQGFVHGVDASLELVDKIRKQEIKDLEITNEQMNRINSRLHSNLIKKEIK